MFTIDESVALASAPLTVPSRAPPASVASALTVVVSPVVLLPLESALSSELRPMPPLELEIVPPEMNVSMSGTTSAVDSALPPLAPSASWTPFVIAVAVATAFEASVTSPLTKTLLLPIDAWTVASLAPSRSTFAFASAPFPAPKSPPASAVASASVRAPP